MSSVNEHELPYADFLYLLGRSTDQLNDDPVRGEFFSVERLESYASHLAETFTIGVGAERGAYVLNELETNGRQLLNAYLKLTEAFRDKELVSPAAEWFIDNFYIVEDQLQQIRRDLPKSYYNGLPKLSTGELRGYPRVYAIALAIIAHTDSRLDAETLKRFLKSYQKVAPLTMGELWAMTTTLRIALIEHLKQLALKIVRARQKRSEADEFADNLLRLATEPDTSPANIVQMFIDKVGKPKQFDRSFIVQLTQRLRDQDPDVLPALDWLENQLVSHHQTNTQAVVLLEHNRQATAQVTVGNIITSLRLLSALDWRDFVEAVSLIEPIFNKDPVGVYPQMDFASRDRYRHAVERLAKRSKYDELQVAQQALEAAQKNYAESETTADARKRAHIGFYLIGDGSTGFENHLGYRPRTTERIHRLVSSNATWVYLAPFSLLTLFFLGSIFKYFKEMGGGNLPGLFFLLLASIPASELALSILNFGFMVFLKPKSLPRMDTEKGIPPEAATMVVIPTLFTSAVGVQQLLDKLEIHFLSNRDPHIYFALLADLADSDQETLPSDAALLELATNGIARLNSKYCEIQNDRFFVFSRKRLFNPCEGKWIGYERKRGKIQEFNRLLRGSTSTSFISVPCQPSFLSTIRYVITLDSDTELPRGAAHKLIGTALHPLNCPDFDRETGRVTAGYAIFQPRMSIGLSSANRTRFAHLFSGAKGLDRYTTTCSDVYQDLFGEGSYIGKGLYVVDAFESALLNRIPDNTVLSHDLFEGCFARSALVSDVELFDDYPTDYSIYLKREHRWIRGDWQIAPWLFPRVASANSDLVPNQLPLIARWKILDNLRRSLLSSAIILLLWLSWLVVPGLPLVWTLLILTLFAFPVYCTGTRGLFQKRQRGSSSDFGRLRLAESLLQTRQILTMIAFMPNQAWNQTDAILRVVYRKIVSHRNLLEWTQFSAAQSKQPSRPLNWLSEGAGPLFSVAATMSLVIWRPESLAVAAPFLIAWFTNPLLSTWLSRKPQMRVRALGPLETTAFRLYARRTWQFFETFVTKEDNDLAPDNVQEELQTVVAHRTSPTNIGIQLLSTSSAYDLGYLGRLDLLDRMERTFKTLGRMERFRGHFFNWYDTQTLTPLHPQYISTVDSGNLAGHLIATKQFLIQLAEKDGFNAQAKNGLIDTLKLMNEEAVHAGNLNSAIAPVAEVLQTLLDSVLTSPWNSPATMRSSLVELLSVLTKVSALLARLNANGFEEFGNRIAAWLLSAQHQAKEFLRDLVFAEQDANSQLRILQERIAPLVTQCDQFISEMDFRFLFDEQRKVFVIGYSVIDRANDNSYYDLLASESRLASFVAIAKGDVPQEHWFRLGRQLTSVKGRPALISWTGTMFEYLMPLLVTKRFSETLLDETYQAVVDRQIDYGKKNKVPWGVSESGYNRRDLQRNFQYRAFGVPGLGLKRGLSADLVISPYSTMLAALIDPFAALLNLKRLETIGALSPYGFYESIDYTPDRLKEDQSHFILKSLMAHHQGMSLVSINNLLNGNIMQHRFHSEPLVQGTQLLLQERIPVEVTIYRPRAEELRSEGARPFAHWKPRIYREIDLPTPRTHLLSNGTYSTMITTTGSGYSRSGSLAINRWREDATRDPWGQFFYIRNRSTNRVWSPAYQPTAVKPEKYEVTFAEDKVEFRREDGETSTHLEVIVSREENVEIRRVSLTNNSENSQEFEVTSYLEAVLAPHRDDIAHPAFSNLFIETEFHPPEGALIATRRRRSAKEEPIWAFHVLIAEGETLGPVQYETDRSKFLGRGRTPLNATAIEANVPLSNTVGAVLDPVFSIRQSVRIPPGQTARFSFATGITQSREEVLRLVDKYHDVHIFNREMELAWTASRAHLLHLNIDSDQTHTFQRLASRVIYSDPSFRAHSRTLALNSKNQTDLWAHGISGDWPIILARINNEDDMRMVRELLHGHEYLRLKGLVIDLVLLNERAPSYLKDVDEELQRQIRMIGSQNLLDKPGGIFIRRADLMAPADVILLKAVSRVLLDSSTGTLREQLNRRKAQDSFPHALVPSAKRRPYPPISQVKEALEFSNGLGGFSDGGREYVTILKEGESTPAPWINVISNSKDFGFLISESGSGYTWSLNSQANRLTPWSNDAVSDPAGEAIYIRDEATGEYWTPTPAPIREKGEYLIRHGQGYSQFQYSSHGISTRLRLFVPLDASVKISCLVLKNDTKEKRRLSVTNFIEWVLGENRGITAPHIFTAKDELSGMLIAKNPYSIEFNHRVAFSFTGGSVDSFTCDRKEFLGRNGNLSSPAGLGRNSLSGRCGAGLDACAALQKQIVLGPGEECELFFLLGQGNDVEEARALVLKYSEAANRKTAYEAVLAYWDEILGAIQIKTPDPAMDMMMNRWLLYQTLSCRLWGRSAFYQSGGAFGFRDQLQDTMALVYSRPEIARSQILLSARHQFVEGDVLHWWHPPSERGVRTHFSDDLLWLPFVVSHYVSTTGDRSILGEIVPFIEAPLLEPQMESAFLLPVLSQEEGTISEHCARALDRSLVTGLHGLPLMGSGDWNDGMNRVGHEGKGESVWLAWFLYRTLGDFLGLLDETEHTRRALYRNHRESLATALHGKAWDGEWYRRAYFDDGTPLGSASNEECQIDSIAQSWAVLSGAGERSRARQAMEAVDAKLVNRKDGIIKLFMPPFNKGSTDPGYIRGYLPGVRENGGQYTHAALWTVMAFASLGDGERATELFALLNPINHSSTKDDLQTYKVEPYVVAADVYGVAPHIGRGGWTWYTGSASWMYRTALESLLGFQLKGDRLQINPSIPEGWAGFQINFRQGTTQFLIHFRNHKTNLASEKGTITFDGVRLDSGEIILVQDGKTHEIRISA